MTTTVALLAAFILVLGAYPIANEPDDSPYDTAHRALLWTAVVIGSAVLALMLGAIVFKTFVIGHRE